MISMIACSYGNQSNGDDEKLVFKEEPSTRKLKYYNGKPTRKYKHYLQLRYKMDNNWIRMLTRFGDKF